jgi:glycosyltransferase involved in cell wall biosynthesis
VSGDIDTSNPRLLLLVTSRQRRGAEVFGEQMADGLAERGWNVDFRALVDAEGPAITAAPLVPRVRSELGRLDLDVIRAVRDRIEAHRPHLIFANGSATLRYAVAARLTKRTPKLVYGSIGEPTFWSSSMLLRARTGLLMSRVDMVTAVSNATRRQLIDGLRLSSKKVAVAPIGAPEAFGDIVPEPPTDHTRLLFIGSLSAEKSPDAAVRTVAMVAKTHPNVQLRIVGGGPMLELLEHQIQEHELHNTVELVGPVDDVKPHLAWADVLVLSSRTEGLPGVLLEAGAAGVPAAAFDVGGVSDVVLDGSTGRLVRREDERALAAAIIDMIDDAGATADMGAAVQRRVLGRYTLRHALDRYDDVFRAAVQGRRPQRLEV